jgi:UDP-N-acetylmuramoylalanine--D-glutamate ligase
MKIAILGYGLQGRSSYEFYAQADNDITICDINEPDDIPSGVKVQFGNNYLDRLDRFDLIIRSPKIHPRDIVAANSADILNKVTSNTNEFFKQCPTTNIIGVTGTKGKGTTSTLITKLLEELGFTVHLGGNIGIPPLDLLKNNISEDDWVVLELANFQLIDLKHSPNIGLCLMVEPEHLDWHTDVDEYYDAKTNMFRSQTVHDLAIYYAANDNSKRIASTGGAKTIPYYAAPGAVVAGDHIAIDGQPIIRVKELQLLGKHNYQNVCAAVTAVWQIQPDAHTFTKVLREFKGLPFRLEFRQKVNDVSYYDDSFASAPPATIAAIEAIRSHKVLIVGGKDRGLDLNELASVIKDHESFIRGVVLIGESAKRVAEALDTAQFNNYSISEDKDMLAIVRSASKLAQAGDSVVLSPGFPSFDMFKDFEDRGNQFNEAVGSL